MTTPIQDDEAASPEVPRSLSEKGWTVLAWGADRHDTREYSVTKQADQGQDVVVVSVSKLDDESIAVTSDGWRYPEEGGPFFAEIATTILGAPDHIDEETRVGVLRRSIDRALFAALDEWPTVKDRLKDIGTITSGVPGRVRLPSTMRSSGADLVNSGIVPTPISPVADVVDGSQDEAVLRFRLIEISAGANHTLSAVDRRWVKGEFNSSGGAGTRPKEVTLRFLELFTLGFIAGAVALLVGSLVATGLLFRDSTEPLLVVSLAIVVLIALVVRMFVNMGRQNRSRCLANLAYLQEVEELRASVQAEQARIAIAHAVEGRRSPVDTLLQGLWVPQSLLYDQAMAFAYKNSRKIML